MLINLVSNLDIHGGAIQAASTAVLVLITFYYAFQTRLAVKEAANTRKDARLPIIRIGVNGPNWMKVNEEKKQYVSFQLKNVGYGIARSITISIPHKQPVVVRSLDTEKEWSVRMMLESGEADKVDNLPRDQKMITVSYQDIFSRDIKTIARFENSHKEEFATFEVTDWELILPT